MSLPTPPPAIPPDDPGEYSAPPLYDIHRPLGPRENAQILRYRGNVIVPKPGAPQ